MQNATAIQTAKTSKRNRRFLAALATLVTAAALAVPAASPGIDSAQAQSYEYPPVGDKF